MGESSRSSSWDLGTGTWDLGPGSWNQGSRIWNQGGSSLGSGTRDQRSGIKDLISGRILEVQLPPFVLGDDGTGFFLWHPGGASGASGAASLQCQQFGIYPPWARFSFVS